MPGRPVAAVAAAALLIAVGFFYFRGSGDETAAVKKRLQGFASEVNSSTTDGRGMEARALQLGSYFADDVEIELGQGAVPIRGRETVVGMAARLQPRTAAFELKFEDVGVTLGPGGDTADVHLTAEFIRRSISTGDQSLDAREFTINMRKVGAEWKMARVTVVDTLKQ